MAYISGFDADAFPDLSTSFACVFVSFDDFLKTINNANTFRTIATELVLYPTSGGSTVTATLEVTLTLQATVGYPL